MKRNLNAANAQLFERSPDERFPSLQSLFRHCQKQKEVSVDRWHPPTVLNPEVSTGNLVVTLGDDGAFLLNDWSFSQLCKLSSVSKDTVNRLSGDTTRRVFEEMMPRGNKPLQILTRDQTVRSIHGTQYTRLWNTDLLAIVKEFASDFTPPQEGMNGATGLYAGEQDMFCFLIDPAGWTEIDGEAFAPGFFLWNSEVGRRSLGLQTFWFQKVCQNHIVWDAVEVTTFSKRHTGSVHESIGEIRCMIEDLVAKRDERKDGFVSVIRKAMGEKLGDDAEETAKALTKHGFSKSAIKAAMEIAKQRGAFTIWSMVDALTRIAGEEQNAGDRTEADTKAAKLLQLVA